MYRKWDNTVISVVDQCRGVPEYRSQLRQEFVFFNRTQSRS